MIDFKVHNSEINEWDNFHEMSCKLYFRTDYYFLRDKNVRVIKVFFLNGESSEKIFGIGLKDIMEGILYRPMAITVAAAVFGSLILALVYVPALSASFSGKV